MLNSCSKFKPPEDSASFQVCNEKRFFGLGFIKKNHSVLVDVAIGNPPSAKSVNTFRTSVQYIPTSKSCIEEHFPCYFPATLQCHNRHGAITITLH